MVLDVTGCGHPGVVANIEASFRALPFTAELGGELKVQNIATVNEQGNVSLCQACISYPKRRASMLVESRHTFRRWKNLSGEHHPIGQ